MKGKGMKEPQEGTRRLGIMSYQRRVMEVILPLAQIVMWLQEGDGISILKVLPRERDRHVLCNQREIGESNHHLFLLLFLPHHNDLPMRVDQEVEVVKISMRHGRGCTSSKSSKRGERISLSLPTFGATDKVLAFIQQFDVAFGDEHFSESSKLQNVSMHFQKLARQWWASLRALG